MHQMKRTMIGKIPDLEGMMSSRDVCFSKLVHISSLQLSSITLRTVLQQDPIYLLLL